MSIFGTKFISFEIHSKVYNIGDNAFPYGIKIVEFKENSDFYSFFIYEWFSNLSCCILMIPENLGDCLKAKDFSDYG